ncbi:hypothetical protein GCM10027161_18130 [Microbispora hainanensis]
MEGSVRSIAGRDRKSAITAAIWVNIYFQQTEPLKDLVRLICVASQPIVMQPLPALNLDPILFRKSQHVTMVG